MPRVSVFHNPFPNFQYSGVDRTDPGSGTSLVKSMALRRRASTKDTFARVCDDDDDGSTRNLRGTFYRILYVERAVLKNLIRKILYESRLGILKGW
jgi:hypothetical protein